MSFRIPIAAARRLGRAARSPIAWLVLQIVSVTVVLSVTGNLTPTRVPDSESYTRAARSTSITTALAQYRTYGYPLLLRLTGRGGDSFGIRFRRLITLQLAAYFAAVFLWWAAVRSFTGSPWLAFAMAAPLLYSRMLGLAGNLQPDFLAAAFVLASVSLLLSLLKRPASRWRWIALAIAVFCSYQLRPAGVFLVGLLPVLGGLLALGVERAGARRSIRLALGLAAVMVLPYIAFCGLRWVTVGHWGLVSFGGVNLSGMASCFVAESLARELPEEHKVLARKILRRRNQLGLSAMTAGDDPEPWFAQYSDNMWHVTLQVAKAQTRVEKNRYKRAGQAYPDSRPLQIIWNERLTRYSQAVIRARPGLYLSWVAAAVRYGLRQLASIPWVLCPFVLLVMSLSLAILAPHHPGATATVFRPLLGLVVLTGSYFVAYLFLVCLVSFPFERYFTSIALLLPSSLCGLLFELWRTRLWPALR